MRGRGLIKEWGTEDLPLSPECERLDRALNPQLEQLVQAARQKNGGQRAEASAFAEAYDQRDPD